MPEGEPPRLEDLFGSDRLAGLLGIASSSMRRYLGHDRYAPDDMAWRAHLLARTAGDLAGSYNELGIRRWFERPRSQLGNRSPAQVLKGPWEPESADVQRVLALSAWRAG